jgi:hypothetical protein
MPLFIHIVITFILDECFKYNLRIGNSILVIHLCLLSIGIITNGMFVKVRNDQFVSNIQTIGSQCMIDEIWAPQKLLFKNFNDDGNISTSFNYFMGFLFAMQIMGIIGIVFLRII